MAPKTPIAEPHTISTATRALVHGAMAARSAPKAKPKVAPKKVVPKAKPKVAARKPAPAVSSTTAAHNALSSSSSNLLGGNIVSSLLGSQSNPAAYDQSLINQLVAQGKTQIGQMNTAAAAAEKAASQWSNDSATNLSNLAKIAGQGGTAPGTYLGDLSANAQALPGVMQQQDLLKSVAGAAQAENQSGMIPGQIAQTALTDQGLFYGAQEKAMSSLQQELAKNQTAMNDSQLAAASRLLAAQITATGGIQKQNISTGGTISAAQIRAGATSNTSNSTNYKNALTNITNAWNGQNASGSKTAVPAISGMTGTAQATALMKALGAQNITPAQRWQIAASKLNNQQLQYLQYTNSSLQGYSGYSKQLSQARNYTKQLKGVVAQAKSPAGVRAAKAKLQSQINSLNSQINALPNTIQAVGQRAQLVAQIDSLKNQMNTVGSVPQSLMTAAFNKMAPAIGVYGAEQLMNSVFGSSAVTSWSNPHGGAGAQSIQAIMSQG